MLNFAHHLPKWWTDLFAAVNCKTTPVFRRKFLSDKNDGHPPTCSTLGYQLFILSLARLVNRQMTLFCDGRVILLAVLTFLHINTLERRPRLLGTSIGEKTRAYASAVGLGKGVSFSCMKWNRSLKLSTRNFRIDLPRIWLEWAHTMTLGRVLGGQFNIIIMLYRRTQLVHLTLLDFWGLSHTRR